MWTKYEMIGQLTIPEDKKEELNSWVLKLLEVGGVRKLETVRLDGKRIKMTKVPKPDAKGIVSFNYSIFEGKEFGNNSYDTNTCQLLSSKDRGGNEFGFILNLIMILQEMYSETPYYMVSKYKYDDTYKVVDVDGYLGVLKELLHIKGGLKHREDYWEIVKAVKREPKTADMSYKDIREGCASYLLDEDEAKWGFNFMAYIYCKEDSLRPGREECRGGRGDIQNGEKYIGEYACNIFKKQLKRYGREKVNEKVRLMLGASLEERQRLAKEENTWGILAEVSVYRPWYIFFNAYRHALGSIDAWELWCELGVECYKDHINAKGRNFSSRDKEKRVESEPEVSYPIYDIFARASGRESHDDFLELCQDIKQLEYSEVLEDAFEDWRKSFDSITDNQVVAMDVEHTLAEVLSQMKKDWGIDQVVSEAFVYEILEHKDSLDHRKLLVLLEEECMGEAMLYPELTVYQSRCWISGIFGKAKIITRIKGLVALIVNIYMRDRILGF